MYSIIGSEASIYLLISFSADSSVTNMIHISCNHMSSNTQDVHIYEWDMKFGWRIPNWAYKTCQHKENSTDRLTSNA